MKIGKFEKRLAIHLLTKGLTSLEGGIDLINGLPEKMHEGLQEAKDVIDLVRGDPEWKHVSREEVAQVIMREIDARKKSESARWEKS